MAQKVTFNPVASPIRSEAMKNTDSDGDFDSSKWIIKLAMKPQKQVEGVEILEIKYEWWWRRRPASVRFDGTMFNTLARNKAGIFWKRKIERPAFCYELMRRLGDLAASPPFIRLKMKELRSFISVFSRVESDEDRPVRIYADWEDGVNLDHDDWVRFDLELNLTKSNAALCEDFLRRIEKEKKEWGISPPQGPKGKANRCPSWLWPELMDRRDREHQRLDRAQDRAYWRAKKAAHRCADIYRDAF